MAVNPVKEVTLGEAANITLDMYYDLVKSHAGNLIADEKLQIKTVCDPVPLSDVNYSDAEPFGHQWFSLRNLINRADKVMVSTGLNDLVQATSGNFSETFGDFLDKLVSTITLVELSAEDHTRLSEIKVARDNLKKELKDTIRAERTEWLEHCEFFDIDKGDEIEYYKWTQDFGYKLDIDALKGERDLLLYEERQIKNKTWSKPEDKTVMEVDAAYHRPSSYLSLPSYADYTYGDAAKNWNIVNLANADTGGALFERLPAIGFSLTIHDIMNVAAGAIDGTLNSASGSSSSIKTDWSASASVSYAFCSVRASASESTAVKEDFKTATGISLDSKAAFRSDIEFGPWYHEGVFMHPNVLANPELFKTWLGPDGSLRYIPTGMLFVRGFSVEFSNKQDWMHDYQHSFSVGGGGGFRCFGFGFSGGYNYSKTTKNHEVAQASTQLKMSDGEDTVRFIGYAVKEQTVYEEAIEDAYRKVGLL